MENKLDKIVSLCKRRGFVFQGSEIHGGLSGVWDYGPLGVLMKENIKQEWWKHMLREDHIYPLDSAILMNEKVFEASGHLEHFSDPLVDCKKCKKRFRQDEIEKCPECGGELGEMHQFNMMFRAGDAYLRPETAQGIFTNFKNILDAFHSVLPFGVAQVGKAFRNEITPKNFLFRAREFEQMELEYFGHPEKQKQYFEDIKKMRMDWFLDLGIKKENIRFRDYKKDELAHYSQATTDIEYNFGLSADGFSELEGIAMRGDYDLSAHEKSGEILKIDGVIPNVVEPSLGLDRAFLAFLLNAYCEDDLGGSTRVVLKLHPKLVPVKVAVFPLMANKENLVKKAKEVHETLKKSLPLPLGASRSVAWDDIGNVGKRYRRQDEIGTPWCVTIDYQTMEDNTVTIRDRDNGEQIRHPIDGLEKYFCDKI